MITATGALPSGGSRLPEHWAYTGEFIEMAVCARWGLDPFTGLETLDPERRAALLAFERVCIRTGWGKS